MTFDDREKISLDEYEVRCPECGAYFLLLTGAPELGEIHGQCPECGYEGEMKITDWRN